MAVYLAFKEIWRERGRFVLFSLVIALITILVLFVAALGSGLADANRQYLDKLGADLLVFQENVDLNLTASRLGQQRLNDVRRVNGVADATLLAFSNGTLIFENDSEDISLVGIDPDSLAAPTLLAGRGLGSKYDAEIIIDEKLAARQNLNVGDPVTLRTIQGTDEQFFTLTVVGITDERQFLFAPSGVLPLATWEKVRPQASAGVASAQPVGNVIAVKVTQGVSPDQLIERLTTLINDIEAADVESAIQAQPGYGPQQVTVNTQRGFALVIGVLVVGGFFQIQTLQKVPQIGMLKAIGTDNRTVGVAALLQIIMVTIMGIAIGGTGVLLLSFGLPDSVPLRFTLPTVISALTSLMLIGPAGGLVSIRLALKIEPLSAIGQNN